MTDTSDPDVSIEALMARLRESAGERATALPEEGSGGTAGSDALRGQADFNQSVAQVLRSTAEHIRHLQDSVAAWEERLRELTDTLRMETLRRARGTRAESRRRQAGYLDLFRGCRAVLDLGCGRGELMELLCEHGIPATGVDLSEDMVDFCRDRGLSVVRADLFVHLEGLADHSLDGVLILQVVEHLVPAEIARLIRLCGRKLQPGGVMVAETMNPGCPVALGSFYLDPTHVRPVPAELLRFLFEQAPFEVRCLRFSAPTGGGERAEVLERAGFAPEAQHYQDYAVIAVRRPEAAREEACES